MIGQWDEGKEGPVRLAPWLASVAKMVWLKWLLVFRLPCVSGRVCDEGRGRVDISTVNKNCLQLFEALRLRKRGLKQGFL